ncbi:hypothetical protein WDJ51_03790 [Rathayibacter sp. YIM 133350]|uniref:hypothetical protein n=1 Tax=Rathayibacter sp. YIM 133350 TaxID=3131992 RepID=UPI00307F834E
MSETDPNGQPGIVDDELTESTEDERAQAQAEQNPGGADSVADTAIDEDIIEATSPGGSPG